MRDAVWNIVSYSAFIVIIVGVFSEKYRNIFFTLGSAALAAYAAVFLNNPLLTVLQILIVISGILQLLKTSRFMTMLMMSVFTITGYLALFDNGLIGDTWPLVGSFGLLGIAFGIAMLPNRYGFITMASGGVLLTLYAFIVSAWVFFFLNIFFTVANVRTYYKTPKAP